MILCQHEGAHLPGYVTQTPTIVAGSDGDGLSDGVNDTNGPGIRRISGNGYIDRAYDGAETRLYLNGASAGATFERGSTRFQVKFTRISSGIVAFDGSTEHISCSTATGPGYEHAFRFKRFNPDGSETIVAELRLTGYGESARWTLTAGEHAEGGASKWRTPEAVANWMRCKSTLILNLSTGRLLVVQSGLYGGWCLRPLTRHDASLIGHCDEPFWQTGDEDEVDGTIPLNSRCVDAFEWLVQDPVQGSGLDSSLQHDSIPACAIVAGDPITVLGDAGALYIGYLSRALGLPEGFILATGPAEVAAAPLSVPSIGTALCAPYDDTLVCGRSLTDPLGSLTGFLGVGLRRFLIGVGAQDIRQTGFLSDIVTVSKTTGGTATMEITSEAVVVTLDGTPTTLTFEAYPTIQAILTKLGTTGSGELACTITELLSSQSAHAAYPSASLIPMEASDIANTPVTVQTRDRAALVTMKQALSGVVGRIRAAGGSAIVSTLLPRGSAGTYASLARTANAVADCEEFNDYIREMADAGLVTLLDLWDLFAGEDGMYSDPALAAAGVIPLLTADVADLLSTPIKTALASLPTTISPVTPTAAGIGAASGLRGAVNMRPVANSFEDAALAMLSMVKGDAVLDGLTLTLKKPNGEDFKTFTVDSVTNPRQRVGS
ncbi:MAG: SGNH/GDSL hydrolase family protein [Phycisphaerae bacterium]|nr:SGNH/GDSL hydrolase family protein [Phycisphaerae bacterium]